MIEVFKIIKQKYDSFAVPELLLSSYNAIRGNIYKLQLNRTKTRKIIFTDKHRKQGVPELSTLPNVARVSSLKILGVTITNGLSASEHVRDVISNSAQTLHALRCGCSEHMACRMKRCS